MVTKVHLPVGWFRFPKFNIPLLNNNSGLLSWWFPVSVYIFQVIQDIPKWKQLFLIKWNSIWGEKWLQEEDQLNIQLKSNRN